MIDLSSKKIALYYYQSLFKTPLTFNGHTLHKREGLLLRMKQFDQYFYAEIAPLPGFSKETLTQARLQIIEVLNDRIAPLTSLFPSVAFAISTINQDISSILSLSQCDLIPLLQGSHMQIIDEYFKINRPSKIKLKVARQSIIKESSLIYKLNKINPNLLIIMDANQRFSFAQASRFLSDINPKSIDYIEELTRNHKNNLTLAKRYHVKIALDETLQDPHFIYQDNPYIKAFVIKPSLIGSVKRVQTFLDLASKYKLQVSISSSFESIIGLSHLMYIAQQNQNNCQITLGIDTMKQFQSRALFDLDNITHDIKQLECIWKNY